MAVSGSTDVRALSLFRQMPCPSLRETQFAAVLQGTRAPPTRAGRTVTLGRAGEAGAGSPARAREVWP